MAIKDFEDITHELTEYELKTILPIVVAKLSAHKGKGNSISNSELRTHIADRGFKYLSPGRVRKIIEHIRQTYLVQYVVAGGRGYFIAENAQELNDWLTSMKQRRNAETRTIQVGEKWLRQMTGAKQPNQYKQPKINLQHNQQAFNL